MKIAVTGGSGFIGKYVVEQLIGKGCEVMVIGSSREKAKLAGWYEQVEFIEMDINANPSNDLMAQIASADSLLHLAWTGLPNYKSLFHFEDNLMPQYFFLKRLVELGQTNITVTGTCFEYGMKNGCLQEDMTAEPGNPYALAKHSLHSFLRALQQVHPFRLKWARLFYMYGAGQSASSILSQLDKAIENKDDHFNMSAGEQVRDYLPIEEVAGKLAKLAMNTNFDGIINCCSGKGIKIRELVENRLKEKNYTMTLNLGFYPYNDYEPFSFWGDNTKWNSIFA